jgi:hypothetical protein
MFKAWIEIEVKDKATGKTVAFKRFPAKSWVGNMVALLRSLFAGCYLSGISGTFYGASTPADMKDVGGASKGIYIIHGVQTGFGCYAAEGIDSVGIVVGTGTTPVSLGQYNLVSKIPHGDGSGQLYYYECVVLSLTTNAAWSFNVERMFDNLSGATITVNEVGLFIYLPTGRAEESIIMLARDVVSGGIQVPSPGTLTVRYIISHSL